MELLSQVWAWYMTEPVEHAIMMFAVADIVVAWTPWRADDDLLKMVKDVVMTILRAKK